MLRKILKILLITGGSIAGMVLILILLIWAGFLNGIIADTISRQAGKNLNAELSIRSLKGNLFSVFSLHNIDIIYESDTLLHAGEIMVDYSLAQLFKKNIRIDLLNLKNIRAHLHQEKDSVWNFMKLAKKEVEKQDTSSGEFSWQIIINDFRVEQLSASIYPLDTTGMIPAYAESDLSLSLFLRGDTIVATLDSMKIITQSPDYELAGLSGRFSKNGEIVAWRNLKLQLKNSLMLSDGTFSPQENVGIEADVNLLPLDFEDIRAIIPDLKVYGSPEIILSIQGNESEYLFESEIAEDEQKIIISGRLSDFRNNPGYFVKILGENLDGSHWTANQKLKTHISGTIELTGNGFDMKENEMTLNADFGEITYNGYSVQDLIINGEKNKDRASGNLSTSTFAGDLKLQFDLRDVFGNPAYDLQAIYSNVDLGDIPGIDSISTDLNGEIHLTGLALTPGKIEANLSLSSGRSFVAGEPIGDFSLDVAYNKRNYNFYLNGFGAPYFNLNAEGNGNTETSGNITFDLELLDPGKFASFFDIPYLNAVGNISGNISGTPDSLKVSANIAIDSIIYDTIRINTFISEISVDLENKIIKGGIDLKTGMIRAGNFSMQSAKITGEYSPDFISAEIGMTISDSVDVSFTGSVEGFENPVIRVNHLGINYNSSEWSTPHDSAYIILNEEFISVNGFTLESGKQNIIAHGRFAFEGTEDLTVETNNIDLQSLPFSDFMPYEVAGSLTSKLVLSGTASQPVIDTRISMKRLDVNGFEVDSVKASIFYEDNLLQLSGRVLTSLYESVEFMLDAPVMISFSDSISILKDDKAFRGSVEIDSLNVEEISGLLPFKNISAAGFADANIEVSNTINDPVITGNIWLKDGRFENAQFGAEYESIQLLASIDSSTLGLDTLSFKTGKGNLAMNGYISLENTDSLELNDFSLKLTTKDFQAVESNSMELNFDSDLDLEGTLGKPGFRGTLGINSSKFNIDYFTEFLSQKTDEPDPPLLIEALKDTIEVVVQDTTSKSPAFSGSAFFKTLEGEAVVDIPGNTWVTGKDMNFELNGSIRAVKASENINLFGELNIRRGYYKIYGRNFDFEKGIITFTGSNDFNPDVDFEIVYSFRDIEKELRDLRLLVTGKLMQPTLRFMLNEDPVEEKDAISYIIFGKSVNQLGEGERDKISGQNLAMGAAVTQLSSVLKGVLQESAGVDVFEVTGGEDWKSGNVTIGKYITNNLFLSYDRSFDFNKQSKTADTERIMLEYQIIRNLILKATNQDINSGFDLILRKTWK